MTSIKQFPKPEISGSMDIYKTMVLENIEHIVKQFRIAVSSFSGSISNDTLEEVYSQQGSENIYQLLNDPESLKNISAREFAIGLSMLLHNNVKNNETGFNRNPEDIRNTLRQFQTDSSKTFAMNESLLRQYLKLKYLDLENMSAQDTVTIFNILREGEPESSQIFLLILLGLDELQVKDNEYPSGINISILQFVRQCLLSNFNDFRCNENKQDSIEWFQEDLNIAKNRIRQLESLNSDESFTNFTSERVTVIGRQTDEINKNGFKESQGPQSYFYFDNAQKIIDFIEKLSDKTLTDEQKNEINSIPNGGEKLLSGDYDISEGRLGYIKHTSEGEYSVCINRSKFSQKDDYNIDERLKNALNVKELPYRQIRTTEYKTAPDSTWYNIEDGTNSFSKVDLSTVINNPKVVYSPRGGLIIVGERDDKTIVLSISAMDNNLNSEALYINPDNTNSLYFLGDMDIKVHLSISFKDKDEEAQYPDLLSRIETNFNNIFRVK